MNISRKKLWYCIIIIAVILVVLTFTPLVTPAGRYTPALWGFPYTLWTGIIISIGLVVVTLIGSFVHPGSGKE